MTGKLPDPLKLKRVLVLMEFEDGSIGAVYSDQPRDTASVEVQHQENPPARWQDADFGTRWNPVPRYRVRIGDLDGLVVHDPGFHDLTVEATARMAMDQWRMGE